ncbi:MAG: hypothetical protein WC607_01435 [Candidatus Micrarchaeia archaeon]
MPKIRSKREAGYGEPFNEGLQGQAGKPHIRSNQDFFVHLGMEGTHERELSFVGEHAKERALLTAKMYARLKEAGVFHPETRFAVYAKGQNIALAMITPRLNEAPEQAQTEKIRQTLESFVKKHGLPELIGDITIGAKYDVGRNFRSDGTKTYLIDPGLFTTYFFGSTPTLEQLRKLAGKKP